MFDETLHGVEEGIEHVSDELFTVIDRHINDDGEIDLIAAGPEIEAVNSVLVAEFMYDDNTLGNGLLDAIRTAKSKRDLLEYM